MSDLYSVLIVQSQPSLKSDAPTGSRPRGYRVYLELAKYSIGRHPERDIVLRDRHISKYHSTLILLPSSHDEELPYYTIQDGNLLGRKSVNGTWVNSDRILIPTKLHDGDVITFCKDCEYPRILFSVEPLEDYEADTVPQEFE